MPKDAATAKLIYRVDTANGPEHCMSESPSSTRHGVADLPSFPKTADRKKQWQELASAPRGTHRQQLATVKTVLPTSRMRPTGGTEKTVGQAPIPMPKGPTKEAQTEKGQARRRLELLARGSRFCQPLLPGFATLLEHQIILPKLFTDPLLQGWTNHAVATCPSTSGHRPSQT